MIKRIGIMAKPQRESICEVVPALRRWLQQRQLEAVVDRETAQCLGEGCGTAREDMAGRVDLLLVLGGDGTLLAAARAMGEHQVPILPVNLGQMGFLTSVKLEEFYPVLEQVIAGNHRVSERSQIEAEVWRGGASQGKYTALNDAVFTKTPLSRIMDFALAVDGQFVSRYRADGLIIATPTGSTAYSLSAGGPIVYPVLDAFIITPICTHTLTNRPLVIPDRFPMEVQFGEESEHFYLTLDGQVGVELHMGDRVTLKKSATTVRLVRPIKKSYFEILRTKLKWGER